MSIVINWEYLDQENEDCCRVLYACISNEDEILYIGKAQDASVLERLNAPDKERFETVLHNFDIEEYHVIVGFIEVDRLTTQLLSDLESLLIYEEQPLGNSSNKLSRSRGRPGQVVRCTGEWPGDAKYVDPGPI